MCEVFTVLYLYFVSCVVSEKSIRAFFYSFKPSTFSVQLFLIFLSSRFTQAQYFGCYCLGIKRLFLLYS